ncbi:uncharacterized protein LOC126964898 [Leptidea sinapis]|uniref:Protein anon-73B1 n=1 Tax=Leptidea sinapis TaxID=189913 RepID=A0A5E4R6Y4_9NEOP|nr:uncharacterized protein LOC126964898 [Leptidea sinapis]VVC99878.1 unnamed protein product [Leptidea sinapis]VVD05100.1 unnamed protein product [Leptidea sinapis]
MIPGEIFTDDLLSTIIRYSLLVGAIFQTICLIACLSLSEIPWEPSAYEKIYTDSEECSSEQSSPGHKASTARSKRHDKKKRR